MGLATIDIVVIVVYAIFIFGLAQFVSREKDGKAKHLSEHFGLRHCRAGADCHPDRVVHGLVAS